MQFSVGVRVGFLKILKYVYMTFETSITSIWYLLYSIQLFLNTSFDFVLSFRCLFVTAYRVSLILIYGILGTLLRVSVYVICAWIYSYVLYFSYEWKISKYLRFNSRDLFIMNDKVIVISSKPACINDFPWWNKNNFCFTIQAIEIFNYFYPHDRKNEFICRNIHFNIKCRKLWCKEIKSFVRICMIFLGIFTDDSDAIATALHGTYEFRSNLSSSAANWIVCQLIARK